jgi:hypothetical protein
VKKKNIYEMNNLANFLVCYSMHESQSKMAMEQWWRQIQPDLNKCKFKSHYFTFIMLLNDSDEQKEKPLFDRVARTDDDDGSAP